MKTTITLTDRQGHVKDAPIGFSWTTLFFGIFPALMRSDWKWGIIQFIIATATFGISWFVMPFLYNKLYIKDLLASGYYPINSDMADQVVAAGIVSLDQMRMYNKLRHPDLESDTQSTPIELVYGED